MLRRRKWRRLVKQHRRRTGAAAVLEWAVTIVVIIAAAIVFQMFVFQNYRIPTASMVPTLQAEDLILVEKVTFGPEIFPGKLKLPALRLPRRGEIVSFESELYAEQGPLVELADRFVYFITLSLVNLKTDENNQPIVDLLIKRVIGLPGDRVRQYRGRFEVLPAGEDRWVGELELMAREGVVYAPVFSSYEKPLSPARGALAQFLDKLTARVRPGTPPEPVDVDRTAWEQKPQDTAAASAWLKAELGWYVPGGMFFPMGDNRPNSRDARVYGPVSVKRIQGKALFRFYPFSRFGSIE
jgi:signal peptidase I